MAQRYTTPVATRVAGGVVSSSDQNDVDDRVVQISADIGGVPGDLNTTDNSSYAAAVNELVARNAAIQFPRQVAAQGFQTKGSSITDFVLTDTGLYKGSSGGTMDVWAPIELPNGEALSELKVWSSLGSTSAQVQVSLRRLDKAAVSSVVIGTVTITGSTGAQSGTAALSHTVDNETYAYFLSGTLTNDASNTGILVAAQVK